MFLLVRTYIVKGKDKVVPVHSKKAYIERVQAQVHSLLTSALDGGGWEVDITPRPIYPVKELLYSLNRRLGRSYSQSERFREDKNLFPLPGLVPRTAQPVASLHTDWAVPAPVLKIVNCVKIASYVT